MSVDSSGGAWRLVECAGAVSELHGLDISALAGGDRTVVVCVPSSSALVIGSTQREAEVDADAALAASVEVVRRRSGGGAVWLHPVDSLWIDLWVPRGDALWTDDVSASMVFAGEAFARALDGLVSATVWRDRFDQGEFGRAVCFASMAPGEVRVGPAKVVGISQRRDKSGARLQCVAYRKWKPSEWSSLLTDESARRGLMTLPVSSVDLTVHELADRLLTALTSN